MNSSTSLYSSIDLQYLSQTPSKAAGPWTQRTACCMPVYNSAYAGDKLYCLATKESVNITYRMALKGKN